MTSQRRWAFLFFILFVSAFALPIACSQAANPPPPATVYMRGDAGTVLEQDTFVPDMYVPDTFIPDTFVPDTFEAAADACESGTIDGGIVGVGPSELYFGNAMGFVNCGTQAQAQTITITNPTCQPIDWMSTVSAANGGYMLTPSSGSMLMPGATQTVEILPTEIPQTSVITSDYYQGTVTITTTAPNDTGHIIKLHETAYGVILTTTAQSSITFPNIQIGQKPTQGYNVSNNGNAPTTASFAVGSAAFTVTASMSGNLPAMASDVVTVTFMPTNVQPYTDQITTTLPSGTPICGPVPAPLQLTGTGVAVPVGVATMPSMLNFNQVPCGGPAAALQTITINNTAPAASFTAVFTTGTSYTLAAYDSASPSTPGTAIPTGLPQTLAMGTTMIDVVPRVLPMPATTSSNGYGDTLTITTTVSGDAPHSITLLETAQGAILTFNPTTVSTSGTPGIMSTTQLSVVNSGNVGASFSLSLGSETEGPPVPGTPAPAMPVFGLNDETDGGVLMGSVGMSGSSTSTFSTVMQLFPPPLYTVTGQTCGVSVDGGAPSTCSTGTCSDAGVCQTTATFQTTSSVHLTPASGTILCAAPPADVVLALTN